MAWNENFERLRARLHNRRHSYRVLFLRADAGRPPRWWQLAFLRAPKGGALGPAAQVVMDDLRRYCYADKTTVKVSQVDQHCDPIAMAFAEGRRDVFNRITAMLNMTDDNIDYIAHHRSQTDE